MRFLPLMLSLVAGCGLVLDVDPNAADGGSGDAGTDASFDAMGDALTDAQTDTAVCVPEMELCSNGADDDCDGMVDEGCDCDAYVHPDGTGDGSSDAAPTRSIGAAIALVADSGGVVCVAGREEDSTCFGAYDEMVTMEEGVNVVGGYRPVPGGWVVDDLCETTIVHSGPGIESVLFPDGLTESTTLARFLVEGPSGAGVSIGVQLVGGGTLQDVAVKAGAVDAEAIGVKVTPGSSERVSILGGYLEGSVGSSAARSVALEVFERQVYVAGQSRIFGTAALSIATAIHAEGADGLTVENVTEIFAGDALVSEAVRIISSDDVVIRGVDEIRGGGGPGESAGVGLSNCDNASIGNVRAIHGGGAGLAARGIFATDGTRVSVRNVREIIGLSVGGLGARPSYGIVCDGTGGARTRCDVEGIALLVGAGVGTLGFGTGAYFEESTGRLAASEVISSRMGGLGVGVVLRLARGVEIDANRFRELSGGSGSGGSRSAIRVIDSVASVTNNYIRVAEDVTGIFVVNGDTLDLDLHSNTITMERATGLPSAESALLRLGPGGELDGGGVDVRHNIFLCRGVGLPFSAVWESSIRARIFAFNIMHGCAEGWRSSVSTYPTDGALLSWLRTRGFLGNRISDPLVDDTGHLMDLSPAIDAGLADEWPLFDIDGDDRSMHGPDPDIGCDEYVP